MNRFQTLADKIWSSLAESADRGRQIIESRRQESQRPQFQTPNIETPQLLTGQEPFIQSSQRLQQGTQQFAEPIVSKGLDLAKKTASKTLEVLNPGSSYVQPKLEEMGGVLGKIAPAIGLGIDILAPGPGELARGGKAVKATEELLTKGAYKETGNLTTKILKELEGKSTVSKQYILDATNRGELKQVERDITRQVLETMPDGQINVQEFADKVKAELLPLKAGHLVRPKYESIALSDELRGDVSNYKERIYQSPIKTSAGDVHFEGSVMKRSNLSPEETSSLQSAKRQFNFYDKEWSKALQKGKQSSIDLYKKLRDEQRRIIRTLETKMETSTTPEGYFGHTRIEDMADNQTRRVIEVQSDLYQKNRLGEINKDFLPENLTPELAARYEKIKPGMVEEGKALNAKIQKLQQYNDPTAHFRMVREEIKKAAQDGKTKLQFPTGETAMKIEGLVNRSDKWVTLDNELVTGANIKKGDLISFQVHEGGIHPDRRFLITENKGDGTFKAVDSLTAENDSGFYELLNKKGALDDGRMPTLEELVNTGNLDAESQKYLEKLSESLSAKDTVDTSNPIYKFYEKDMQKYLNKFNGKRVIDKQGVEWIEVPIKKEMAKMPVEAFGLAPLLGSKKDEKEE